MRYPIIKHFVSEENFKFVWLKYIFGFDLSIHCAKCLIGKYSAHIPFGIKNGIKIIDKPLNEEKSRLFYLCGVTTPYRYEDNLHIAFEYAEGEVLRYNDDKTSIEIENARWIPIKVLDYSQHPCGKMREYNTCRNWRFAYQQIFNKTIMK